MPSKSKNEAKRGPEKLEEWWACATNERNRGAETLFDRKFRRQRGRNPHARHVQYLLWQPGVRGPTPVSTKRALSGLKPRNWASLSANTHQAPCSCEKNQCNPSIGNHRHLCSRWNDRGFRRGRPTGVSTSGESGFAEYFTRAHAIGPAPLGTYGGLIRDGGGMRSLSRHSALSEPLPGTPEAW